MNSIISSMNDVLSDWKQQHDIFSAIPSKFSEEQGFICFAGHPLCKADDGLLLESAEFDSESIEFFLTENRSVLLNISWPEDEPPVISSVLFVYHLSDEAQ